jgi:hypothetical protein
LIKTTIGAEVSKNNFQLSGKLQIQVPKITRSNLSDPTSNHKFYKVRKTIFQRPGSNCLAFLFLVNPLFFRQLKDVKARHTTCDNGNTSNYLQHITAYHTRKIPHGLELGFEFEVSLKLGNRNLKLP